MNTGEICEKWDNDMLQLILD